MTGQDPFDRIRTYLDIAQRAFEEIVDTYTPKHAQGESFDDVEAALDALGVDKHAPEAAPEPDGALWEVALRDNIGGTIEFRADEIHYGAEDDCGIKAFVNHKLTFYAPSGTYLFARKVVE